MPIGDADFAAKLKKLGDYVAAEMPGLMYILGLFDKDLNLAHGSNIPVEGMPVLLDMLRATVRDAVLGAPPGRPASSRDMANLMADDFIKQIPEPFVALITVGAKMDDGGLHLETRSTLGAREQAELAGEVHRRLVVIAQKKPGD